MPINYPTSLDTLTNPIPGGTGIGSPITSPNHADQHANANDAIEALQAKVGITASTPARGKRLLSDATGSTLYDRIGRYDVREWGSITGADNTAVVQAAITEVSTLETEVDGSAGNDGETVHGGVLQLPTNLLWVSGLTMASNVVLEGPGHNHGRTGTNKGAYVARLKQLASSDQPLITVPKGVIGYGFRRISMDGNKSHQTQSITNHDGIHIEEVNVSQFAANVATLNAPFEGLVIENFLGKGINCSAVHIAPHINDCLIRRCDIGIRMGCTDWRISGTNITACTTYGLWVAKGQGRLIALDIFGNGRGVHIDEDPAFGYGSPKRVTGFGCHISNNDKEAVYVGSGTTITSWTACHFYDNSEAGAGLYSNVLIDSTDSSHSFDAACVFGDTASNVMYDIEIGGGATVTDYALHQGGYATNGGISNHFELLRDYRQEGQPNNAHISFDTPGDLAVTYSRRFLRWEKHGRKVTVYIDLVTSSFTYTTASGTFAVQALPFDAKNLSGSGNGLGPCAMTGWNKAGYTQTNFRGPAGGGPNIRVRISGPGQPLADLTTAEIPSGSTIQILGSLEYEV